MLTDKFWDKYFEVYDTLNELYPYRDLLDTLVNNANISPGMQVLDAGSGTGNISKRIAKQGGKVYAIDISDAGTRKLLEKIPDAEAYIGSLCDRLPYEDNFFDVIVSNNVIYTLPEKDRPSVAKEFYRVLKPGGCVVVSNISPGFSPMAIYFNHIDTELKKHGIFGTFRKILKFIVPTFKIFWYNLKINMENGGGSYVFLDEDSQEAFLKEGGFEDVSFLGRCYAEQGVMHRAKK